MFVDWKGIYFVLACIAFSFALYIWVKSKMVKNTDKILFLSTEDLQSVLMKDADHYYQSLNDIDLKLRKSNSVEDYKGKIFSSCCEGTEDNKLKIINCIKKLEIKLEPIRDESANGIEIAKMLDLPWKIGFICDKKYENGLPHTRKDVIIVSNKEIESKTLEETCKLLIHEKTHVYQKVYEKEFSRYLENDYTKKKVRKETPSNPDADGYVYTNKKDGTLLEATYNKNPKGFRDIKFPKNDFKSEHPNEISAYKMEELYD